MPRDVALKHLAEAARRANDEARMTYADWRAMPFEVTDEYSWATRTSSRYALRAIYAMAAETVLWEKTR